MIARRALIGGLLAAPLVTAAGAQQRKARIIVLHSGFPHLTPLHLLVDHLKRLGYENGRSATVEIEGGEGNPARLDALVAKIVSDPPDVTVAVTSPAARALKAAGLATPVVFLVVSDPIGLGLAETLARPGGNFTGITGIDPSVAEKRMELLADALPGLRRLAILWNDVSAEGVAMAVTARAAAVARGITVIEREYGNLEDIAAAFAEVKAAGAEAVVFGTSNVSFGHRADIAGFALAHRLPSVYSFPQEVEDGGLISYGVDLDDQYRRAAALIDKILKGARPADLPVEGPTRFTLAVNLRTATALGIAIPPALLARADIVIE
jgi:putative ABC transport system substrate-binding protein